MNSKSKKKFDQVIERSEYQNNKLRYFKIYLLLVNIYVLSLVFDVSFGSLPIIIPGIILLIIPLLAIMLASKPSIEKRFKGSKLDPLRMIQKYLYINRKYLIISIIGLAVPIMIISQTIIVTSVFDQQAIGDFLENTNQNALEIIYPIENSVDFTNFKSELQDKVEETLSSQELEFNNLTSKITLGLDMQIGDPYNDSGQINIQTAALTSHIWSNEYLQFITQLPSFNQTISENMDETLLILPSWVPEYIVNFTDYISNNTFNAIFSGYDGAKNYQISNNIVVIFDHYWIPQQVDFNYLNQFDIDESLVQILYGGLLLPEDGLWEINDKMNNFYESDNIIYGRIFTHSSSQVTIQFPKLEEIDLSRLKLKLFRFQTEMNSWLSNQSPLSDSYDFFITIDSPLFVSIDDYEENLGVTNEILLIIVGPLVGLGLVFVMFTLRLVEEKRKVIVAIIKNRWISNEQLQLLFFAELVIVSASSIFFGMVISIPFTVYSLNASDLTVVSLSNLPIPPSWYWKIPLFGLLFSLNVNVTSYHRMMNSRYEDAEDMFEHSNPAWQKYYIDVTLFAIGMGYWILESLQVFSSPNATIGTIMLLLTIFSAPLILTRYFSVIIGHILNSLLRVFRSRGGLIKIASRNLIKHKFSTAQLAGLLLLGMMLTLVSHVVPTTYDDWGVEKNHYEL